MITPRDPITNAREGGAVTINDSVSGNARRMGLPVYFQPRWLHLLLLAPVLLIGMPALRLYSYHCEWKRERSLWDSSFSLAGIERWELEPIDVGWYAPFVRPKYRVRLCQVALSTQFEEPAEVVQTLEWLLACQHVRKLRVTGDDVICRCRGNLHHWSRLNNLEFVATNESFTESDAIEIARLRELRNLEIEFPCTEPRALQHISKCINLRTLRAGATPVSPEAADALLKLGELEVLEVGQTNDEAVKKLSRLAHLTTLTVQGADVTGNCVDDVTQLPALKRITLRGTSLQHEDVCRLKKLRPDVIVAY